MRSQNADRFNHDEDAPGYDRDVLDPSDPIRAGYERVLDWVAQRSSIDSGSTVLELGSGTGNLTLRLLSATELVCVDISEAMTLIARSKVAAASGTAAVEWVRADLLEYFDSCTRSFDVVASAYTVHHLTEEEKELLFEQVVRILRPGGRAVFGDLMFASAAAHREILNGYRRAGRRELVEVIGDEFFWDLERARHALERLGLVVDAVRFSELSWGVAAKRGAGP